MENKGDFIKLKKIREEYHKYNGRVLVCDLEYKLNNYGAKLLGVEKLKARATSMADTEKEFNLDFGKRLSFHKAKFKIIKNINGILNKKMDEAKNVQKAIDKELIFWYEKGCEMCYFPKLKQDDK